MTRGRNRVATAIVLGMALGTALAVADRGPASSTAAPLAGAGASTTVPAAPLPSPRDVRIAIRRPSAAGGPDWAVRTFTSTLKSQQLQCAQLGRLDAGRFGWVTPGKSLRPALFDSIDVPTVCDGKRFLERIDLQILRATITTGPPAGSLAPEQTITWGHTAVDVTQVRANGFTATPAAGGAFLHVERGPGPRGLPSGTVRFADRRVRAFDRASGVRPRRAQREMPTGRLRVAVRAPDPAGGLGWAILAARGSRASTCLSQPDHVLGDRLGRLDARLGLFQADPFQLTLRCPDSRRPATRAFPARLTAGLYSGPDVNPVDGRTELRRLDGRTVLSGRLHDDVVAVTLRTPRDVRTLIPSRLGHAILAVYDGTFPSGRITVTSRFRDGRLVTQDVSNGGA